MMTDKLKKEYWLTGDVNELVWTMATSDARSLCKDGEKHDWEEIPELSYQRSRVVGCRKCKKTTAVMYMATSSKKDKLIN